MRVSYLNKEVKKKTEQEIWSDFKKGNNDAFYHIYDSYVDTLFDFGCRIINDEDLIKDCIHDLFVTLGKNRKTIGNTDSIKLYLFKSLRRKIIKTVKRKRRLVLNQDWFDGYKMKNDDSIETLLINQEWNTEIEQKLKKAIDNLPKRNKEAIYLKFYKNLSYDEIAEIMDINKQSIYNLISSSIETLKKELKVPALIVLLFFYL